jgi:hypothetical protein
MKTDLYLKTVLTVIAICLLHSVAKDVITPAQAQTGRPVDVNLVSVNGISVFTPLQVRVSP